MLDKFTILQGLNAAGFNKPIHIHVLESVNSTNQFLKELPISNTIDICCAETQTQGRGRFGRKWHSPFGENIYLSIRWHFDGALSQLSGLGLVVSMAILATLTTIDHCKDVLIKWPNDLIWKDKKLCGSLIESIGGRHTNPGVIIGIGLNVNAINHELNPIDKPWCSLYEITNTHVKRNTLITQLILQLDQHLQQLLTKGFSSFIPTWKQTDYLYGQLITVSQPKGELSGTAHGIHETGQLILIDTKGVTHYLSSGDTSVRCVKHLEFGK